MTRHRPFDWYIGAAAVYAVVAVVGSLVLAGPENPAFVSSTTGLFVLFIALSFVAGRLVRAGWEAAPGRRRQATGPKADEEGGPS